MARNNGTSAFLAFLFFARVLSTIKKDWMSAGSMQTHISLNNAAVVLLEKGQHRASLSAFHEALSVAHDLMVLSKKWDDDDCPTIAVVPLIPSKIDVNGDCSGACSPHNLFCIYNQAFVLPSTAGTNDMAATFIIFNMGLATHLQSLGTGSDSFMLAALNIYQYVFALIDKVATSRTSGSDVDASFLRVLRLATYSNIGHINSHLMNAKEAERCSREIAAILADGSFEDTVISKPEFAIFWANSMAMTTLHRGVWASAA